MTVPVYVVRTSSRVESLPLLSHKSRVKGISGAILIFNNYHKSRTARGKAKLPESNCRESRAGYIRDVSYT